MEQQKNYTSQFSGLITIFFMWGFIQSMNDLLIPHLKELFSLTYFESMLIQFAFFGAYFIGSLIYFIISYYKGDPINKMGYKNGMILGLAISALGCLLFYPAATLSVYFLFLLALFILGLGLTLLQIVGNPYVSLLGDERSASSRLNLAQGVNSLGTTVAPVLGGFLIFDFFSENGEITSGATKFPYIIFAVIFLLVGLLVYKIKFPSFKSDDTELDKLGALKFSQLKLGMLAIFFYVGAEVTIGSFMINFLIEPQVMNVSELIAKDYLALYWGGAMIGRFLGAISLNHKIPKMMKIIYMVGTAILVFVLLLSIVNLDFKQISYFLIFIILNLVAFIIGRYAPARTLSIFAIVNILLVLTTIFSTGHIAMWAILSVGLFNSIMWSNIFTLSISGLGKYTAQGSSLLVMAILGGAVIPLIQGGLADSIGIRYSYFLPVLCYVYITFFAVYCMTKKMS